MPRTKPTYPVIRVRGGGGAEFDLDVHPKGTRQRELLDEKLAKRDLIVVSGGDVLDDGDDTPPPAPRSSRTPETPDEADEVPAGTIDDVLAWVRGGPEGEPAADGWEDRAEQALAALVVSGGDVLDDGDDTPPPAPRSSRTPETPDEADEVPAGTIDDVLAWVRGGPEGEPAADGWEDRAEQALAAERADDKPRTTLIARLEDALDEEVSDGSA